MGELSTVWVRLLGFEVDPNVITADVGVEPTVTNRIGEPVAPNSILRAKHNTWNLGVEQQNEQEYLDDVLRRLLGTIDIDRLRSARSKYNCELQIGFRVWMNSAQDGFAMDDELVAAVAAAGASIDVDIYFVGNETEEYTETSE